MAAKKKPKVKVYTVREKEPEKKAFDGFIKHPWYAVAGAAVAGALLAALFWRKKR